jgi:Chitin synthase export chaperone
MIYHIRSKYTAVGEPQFPICCEARSGRFADEASEITGRKEIVMFFYLYALIEALAIFLDSGIIPTANTVYPVRRRNLSLLQLHL